ncbi:Serine/threonine protein kinase [Labilithrix luteola]|uniref:Serine/threonine protein kinase n=1 Tax=Labilithrix luteola TaxID=1391654 RepID=A0A0K1PSX7_9BACT|nr:Serine/threonine protein kinase [Labilithrix luteola]
MIEAPIGEGGMGEVYRAYDEKLRRKVALKVLHPDLAVPDAAARLVREARAAAALAHPNTIAIHDLGEMDGHVFLVMELVSGAPLRAYVEDVSVPITQKLRWLADIARGLGAAHKAGLVHRDVKPANVMVSDEGVVKVLDFGLAKPIEAGSMNTEVGLIAGTPRYMAPELFTGGRADARSDEFAFGVTAYELLSGGMHPGNPVGPVPVALDTIVSGISPTIAGIIARTLSRAPEDRHGSMVEIANAIEQELGITRSQIRSEPAPMTRREGAKPRGSTELALARTDFVPSTTTRNNHPAGSSEPSAASGAAMRAVTTTRTVTKVADSLEPRKRGGSLGLVVGVFVLLGAGGYGAMQLLPEKSAPHGASAVVADAQALVADAETDAPSEDAAALAVEADASSDAEADADADTDADAESDAEAGSWQVAPADIFEDPWKKRR